MIIVTTKEQLDRALPGQIREAGLILYKTDTGYRIAKDRYDVTKNLAEQQQEILSETGMAQAVLLAAQFLQDET